MNIAEFLKELEKMVINPEERNVANTMINDALIDTCAVFDSSKPYETGIRHPKYNRGNWVIVELYDTREKALKGHERWVKLFSLEDKLPTYLANVDKSIINDLAREITGENLNRMYKYEEN